MSDFGFFFFFSGFLSDELYLLDILNDEIKSTFYYFVCVIMGMDGMAMIWHIRLGHLWTTECSN